MTVSQGHTHRRLGLAVIAVLIGVAGLAAAAAPAVAGAPKVTCDTPGDGEGTPLEGVCDYLEGREGVFQVGLYDNTSGQTYGLKTGRDKQYTASIVKANILAKWLRAYQRGREIPKDLPYSIRYLMENMIEHSDNVAATSLFYFGGGCNALTRFNRLIPMNQTEVACETPNYYGWGNTITTALDQVRLMRLFAYGKPRRVLRDDARAYGNSLMQSIQPDQRFGITCGPWGASCDPPNWAQPVPGTTVSLKNGWKTLPTCTQPIPQCPWQVNSGGWVNGQGREYVLSVLTTDDPVGSGDIYGFRYGIETIQGVSRRIWDNLAPTSSQACAQAQSDYADASAKLDAAQERGKQSKIKKARKKKRKAKQAVAEAC